MTHLGKKVLILMICVLCAGVILFSSAATNVQASSEGGQIIDKIYIPECGYRVRYQGELRDFIAPAHYMFVVIVNKNEVDTLVVDREAYLKYNMNEEYYRSE